MGGMYVLLGVYRPKSPLSERDVAKRVKVLGPFPTPDEARTMANALGQAGPDMLFEVLPLQGAA